MEKIHKDALRKTRIRLVRDLHPDAEMWDILVTEGIFTPIMMEYIQAERTRADKVRRLLDDLVRRGPKAYQKFLKCLRDSEHEDLANTLEDNEYTLRGLPVPFRAEDPKRQGRPEFVPSAPSTEASQHFINIEPFPVQEFSGEGRVVQQNPVTHYQPSAEGESGPASMAGSLVTPSGVGISPAANQNQSHPMMVGNSSSQPGSFMSSASSTSQSGGDIATGNAASQPGGPIATGNTASQPGGHIATGNTASQPGGYIVTENISGQSEEDDIVMESADAPAPEIAIQTAYQRATAERPTYRMESNPRGYCLIINNRDYTVESLMDSRVGTDVNRDELNNVFTELGFQVDAKDNLTGEAMKDTLKDFAAYDGLPGVDSIIVAFLCHGNSEKMYGVDGTPIYVQEDVFKVFSPRQCPIMKGKPKLFLMNSCRGEMRDIGYPATGTTIGGTVPFDAANTDAAPKPPRPLNDITLTPNLQDLYIAYSTFHGHVSYRNREEGSWFIRKLVEVFREQAALCDINAMMTQVNRRVASMYDPHSMEVQVPAPCSTLTKDWYFNPPPSV